MNLEATISGPLKDHDDIFLCKGKYEGQDWEGAIQKKGNNAVPVLMSKVKSKFGSHKIISYSGGILSKLTSTNKGTKVTFKNIHVVSREDKKDSIDDVLEKNEELKKIIQEQSSNQGESNKMFGEMMAKMEEMENRLAKYEAKEASEEESPESPNEDTAGTTKPGTKKKS